MPQMSDYELWSRNVRISPLLAPHNCTDGFLYAYGECRQHIWMRVFVRQLFLLADQGRRGRFEQTGRDLDTGEWRHCYFELLALEEYDAGYRLVISP